MKFFRSMSENESNNWNMGAILGFYTYMLLLAVNQFLVFSSNLFSSVLIFWAGLIVAFGYANFLNLKYKGKSDKNNV